MITTISGCHVSVFLFSAVVAIIWKRGSRIIRALKEALPEINFVEQNNALHSSRQAGKQVSLWAVVKVQGPKDQGGYGFWLGGWGGVESLEPWSVSG